MSLNQIAKADDIKISNLPALKQGFAYSIIDKQFNYTATTDIMGKWGLMLGAGYSGRAENTGDKIIATFTYRLGDLQKWIDVPIAKYVDLSVGVYYGIGRIGGSNEQDYGLMANIVSIKF